MELETVFSLSSQAAVVGWLALALFPGRRWSTGVLAPIVISGLLAVVYGVLVLPRLLGADGGFGSLEGVETLFESRELLLAGWLHYLAFDLFIGAWEVRDARRAGLPHLLVLPCLAATFLLGPLGLALYLALRASRGRVVIDEA